MGMLVVLGFSLIIGSMVRKHLNGRVRPQGEDLRTVSFDQERPRALSYTEMMNSGKQRMDQTSHGSD
ncbi:hypothetical protein KQ300_13130 [Synechococcus sp. CS-1331]|uniref:hypothetical protein n=1 Tax=Synechococcus sp. CS-1331 TaxID=2847973 RepID=UPI00223A6ECC|nr:hypothetical protein [Synechococcus sp. CS-1331]MCT0229128.1 hypothetical protein [Synechococcus sp. CS-1331]